MMKPELELQHVGIYARNLEESIDFYRDVLGFEHVYSTNAMEGDKPLRMAWIRNSKGVVIELIEQEDKTCIDGTGIGNNHMTFRIDDMDAFVKHLGDHGIEIEAGPFPAAMPFGKSLSEDERSMFRECSDEGAELNIMFFRGPGNERFEVLQDNVGPLGCRG